jgi:excisionase family DNA binding protein
MAYESTAFIENLPSMLTIQEASDLLHVHTNTLRRWSDRGILLAYRIGPRGDRRFMRADIFGFLAESNSYKDNGK